MIGRLRSRPSSRGDLADVLDGLLVEPDPVARSGQPAREVVHDLASPGPAPRASSSHAACRLGEHRVVVGVVVAEDEAALAVGDVPGHDRHRGVPARLGDHALRHVDAVVEAGALDALAGEQIPHRSRRQQRRFEEAAERGFRAVRSGPGGRGRRSGATPPARALRRRGRASDRWESPRSGTVLASCRASDRSCSETNSLYRHTGNPCVA